MNLVQENTNFHRGSDSRARGKCSLALDSFSPRFPRVQFNSLCEKQKPVVPLATFVALQVWYGIPNERVPKSTLK